MLLTRCNNVLTAEKKAYEYRIDGLIFIPLFNAQKDLNTDIPDYIGGKWEGILNGNHQNLLIFK